MFPLMCGLIESGVVVEAQFSASDHDVKEELPESHPELLHSQFKGKIYSLPILSVTNHT